jgi:hypothetical protein
MRAGVRTLQVEALIISKLEELEKSGFSATAIEAAVNTIEFSLRENNTGSFPRGLSLMLRAVGAWIYDRDPFTQMQARAALEARAPHCPTPLPSSTGHLTRQLTAPHTPSRPEAHGLPHARNRQPAHAPPRRATARCTHGPTCVTDLGDLCDRPV